VAHAERGARFLVWLPCAPGNRSSCACGQRVGPPAPPAPPPPAPPPPAQATKVSLAGIRVLLVDDEELIRRPMARFLGKRGAEVTRPAMAWRPWSGSAAASSLR